MMDKIDRYNGVVTRATRVWDRDHVPKAPEYRNRVRFCLCLNDMDERGMHLGNLMVLLVNWVACQRFGTKLVLRCGYSWEDEFAYWPNLPEGPKLQVLSDMKRLGIQPEIVYDEYDYLDKYVSFCSQLWGVGVARETKANLAETCQKAFGNNPYMDGFLGYCAQAGLQHPLTVPTVREEVADVCQRVMSYEPVTDDFVLMQGVRESCMNVHDDLRYGFRFVIRGVDLVPTYLPIENAIYRGLKSTSPALVHLPTVKVDRVKMSKSFHNTDGYYLHDIMDRAGVEYGILDVLSICMNIPIDYTLSDVYEKFEWSWLKSRSSVDVEETRLNWKV